MLLQFLPVLFAGAAVVVLGFIWYHPRVFGTAWMRMIGTTPEQAEAGKKKMPLMALIGLLAAMWLAWVMSYVLQAFGVFDWIGAIDVSFWLWVGFVAPIMLGVVLWEHKSFKLYLINAGYWLVAMLIIGVLVQ